MWTFLCYVSNTGDDAIDTWYARQEASVRGAIDAVLEGLSHVSRGQWRTSTFEDLGLRGQSECAGLSEIKIEVDKVHYRIFGVFGSRPREFILLWPFRKDTDPDYRISCLAAQSRRTEIEYDATRLRRCQFP